MINTRNMIKILINLPRRVRKKLQRESYLRNRRRMFDLDPDYMAYNIFDYNFVIRDRRPKTQEVYDGNMMYGIGGVLREYTGYGKKIYCAVEHGTPTEREDNVVEYRDNRMPVLLLHSDQRRDFLKDKTDKVMFTIGPNFMPYEKGLYSDFSLKSTKKNLGKTLLIYPQHNNDTSEFVEFTHNRDQLIEYVKKVKEIGGFSTVVVCLYYIDVERGMQFFYEQQGWIVVSAGKNTNYDFPACFKTILKISDYVIAQSITGIAFAMYENIPCTFYPGAREMINENGKIVEDAWTINGKSWIAKTEQELCRLFGDYSEKITDEQKAWCEYIWGYNCVKTPEELKLIFDFSRAIRKHYRNHEYVRKVSTRKKYEKIKVYIEDALLASERV